MWFRKSVRDLVLRRDYDALVKRHQRGEAVVPELIRLLGDKDEDARALAARALVLIGGKDPSLVREAVPGLIPLLGDRDANVRGWAAWALGGIGEKEPSLVEGALGPLREASHQVPQAREAVERIKAARRERSHQETLAAMEEAARDLEGARAFDALDLGGPRQTLEAARRALQEGQAQEARALANRAREAVEGLRRGARPQVALRLSRTTFEPGTWEDLALTLHNAGNAHAGRQPPVSQEGGGGVPPGRCAS